MHRSSLARPRHRNAPRPAEKSAKGFLQWLRGRDCVLAHRRDGGCGLAKPPRKSPVEAAHVDYAAKHSSEAKGMSSKTADRWALPLCQRHHDEQGGKVGAFKSRGGWPTFELKYGIKADELAKEYWLLWPGRRRWEEQNLG
jgi:hypothetical protein